MINEYVIWFANNDSIKIRIEQRDRPNNLDDYDLISEYILNNYGHVVYEIIELKTIEKILII
ncbi:hypothetical protein NSA24_03050 [Clostridioides mangenotii]|uniref:hypothetical protein n=1 Tax=Metaclostridioides mangenotii TaxID=1540 RepID=UPI00214A2D18|nr:hypothetical protein [Clostridioides mangenotii]MCR1953812.1 hypothetical protein [Clostridioides mangenotii]